MNTYNHVLDSFAWIEFFKGESPGEKVKAIIDNPENQIYTNAVNIAEIASFVVREKRSINVVELIRSNSKIINVDEEFADSAGKLYAEIKAKTKNFSYGDAFALLTARNLGAVLVTGDPDFKGMKDVFLINE